MNRGEFVAAISDQSGLTKADADRALEAMFKVVKKTLKSGDTVSLVGFGTFVVRKRAARTGRNPRTGDTIKIKASKVPAFKAGKALKDAVGWRRRSVFENSCRGTEVFFGADFLVAKPGA
jgi:DNA-binding protein HU-beta